MERIRKDKFIRTAEKLLTLLADSDYSEIVQWTKNNRLKESDIRAAVLDYGRKVSRPPNSHYEKLDIIAITDSMPRAWSVTLPLWTLEEGESDLSVEFTCVDNKNDTFDVELDGIHVL